MGNRIYKVKNQPIKEIDGKWFMQCYECENWEIENSIHNRRNCRPFIFSYEAD